MIAYAGKRSRVGEIVVFLCLLLLAVSTERMHGRDELYVLNVNPPSVSVIDSESFEIANTIPLAGPPSFCHVGPRKEYPLRFA